jgi:hypothetical protein
LKSGSGFVSLAFLFLYLRLSPLRVFVCSSGANGASNPMQEQQAGELVRKISVPLALLWPGLFGKFLAGNSRLSELWCFL